MGDRFVLIVPAISYCWSQHEYFKFITLVCVAKFRLYINFEINILETNASEKQCKHGNIYEHLQLGSEWKSSIRIRSNIFRFQDTAIYRVFFFLFSLYSSDTHKSNIILYLFPINVAMDN